MYQAEAILFSTVFRISFWIEAYSCELLALFVNIGLFLRRIAGHGYYRTGAPPLCMRTRDGCGLGPHMLPYM